MSADDTPGDSSAASPSWQMVGSPSDGDMVESESGSRDQSKRALPFDEDRQSKSPRSCSPAPPSFPSIADSSSRDQSGAVYAEARNRDGHDPAGMMDQVALLSDDAARANALLGDGGGEIGLRPALDTAKAPRVDQAPGAGEGTEVGPAITLPGFEVTPGIAVGGCENVMPATIGGAKRAVEGSDVGIRAKCDHGVLWEPCLN